MAFVSALFACVCGVALGLIGGWLRGFGELVTVRLVDVILCFPPILLALLVVTLLGPGAETMILVLSDPLHDGLCARDLRRGAVRAQQRLCRGCARAGRWPRPHPRPHHPAEHRRAGAGAVLAYGGGRHCGGERPVLSRPRRGAASPVLGLDDPRRAHNDGAGAIAADLALRRTHFDHHGYEHVVRRAARLGRPAHRRGPSAPAGDRPAAAWVGSGPSGAGAPCSMCAA